MLKYSISLAVILSIIWLVFSSQWNHPILLPLGAASIALTLYLAYRMHILDREGHPIHLLVPILKYLPWLIKEVIKANLIVASHIVRGPKSLSPRICRLRNSQETDLGRIFLANSITLTPGTVTVYVREQEVWFYALTEELEQGVLNGEMDGRVTQLEGEQ